MSSATIIANVTTTSTVIANLPGNVIDGTRTVAVVATAMTGPAGTGGLPAGGSVGQVVTSISPGAGSWQTPASAAVTSVNTQTGDVVLGASDVGLGNVDNTSDASKVFAGSQITSGTVPIARLPTGTGSSNVPLGGVITGAGPTGDASHTLALTYNAAGQLTAVTNNAIAIAASQVTSGLSGTYAPLASPTFTGTVTLPAATVTLAMMADLAASTLIGRITSTGVPQALTATQVRTMLALTIGTDVQAYDADLTTYAGITPGALGQAILPMTTLTSHGVLLGAGASAPTALALDASTTKYLQSGGSSAGPAWATIPVADITGAAPTASRDATAATLTITMASAVVPATVSVPDPVVARFPVVEIVPAAEMVSLRRRAERPAPELGVVTNSILLPCTDVPVHASVAMKSMRLALARCPTVVSY